MGFNRRAVTRDEAEALTDRYLSTIVIAAAIIAAVRLVRDEISRSTPKLIGTVADGVQLARTILKEVIRVR